MADRTKCNINYVVLDSDWEAELARVLESHRKVRASAKNSGECPYRDGAVPISRSRCCASVRTYSADSTGRYSPLASGARSSRTAGFASGAGLGLRPRLNRGFSRLLRLEDDETVHNAFFDRNFREDEP